MKKLIILIGILLLTSCGLEKDIKGIVNNFNEKLILKEVCDPSIAQAWGYRPNIFWEEKYDVDLTGMVLEEPFPIPEILFESIRNDIENYLDSHIAEIENVCAEDTELCASGVFNGARAVIRVQLAEYEKEAIMSNIKEYIKVVFSGNDSSGTFKVTLTEDGKEIFADFDDTIDPDNISDLLNGSYKTTCKTLTIDLTNNIGLIQTTLSEIKLTK
jgi:hypothetical protein